MTSAIIGAAMEVHRIIGNGFMELVYQRALAHEFKLRNINFKREEAVKIIYKGEKVGERRVDFLVNGIIPVELKAVIELEDVHLAQAINYLEAFNLEIGLLINFGATSLEFKRLTNKKFIP
jgi:GxxExxY protein